MNTESIYKEFHSAIASFDCGDRCSPHNERGVPFCCDTRHVIPSAYLAEWEYLQANTNLWRRWQDDKMAYSRDLKETLPDYQVLIVCLGHSQCQREYRSIACRSFPFFPYIDLQGKFLGLSYYWEFEERCWLLSNLHRVSREYVDQFVSTYEKLFIMMPEEHKNFRYHSIRMRRIFGRRRKTIPLLHRNGHAYKVTPANGRMRRVSGDEFPVHGVYKIIAELPFPDEVEI